MFKLILTGVLAVTLLSSSAVSLPGQTTSKEKAAKAIAVLKSDATQKEKADACRELAVIGGKEAVPTLAALLADEKLAHMARYAMESMPDPAVCEALRQALGQLKGRLLVGVIGSIGVRRDARAVEALAKLLKDPDKEVAEATARALGKIGTPAASRALQNALGKPPQLVVCEGLLRCAEALAAKGQREEAVAIFDRLRSLSSAPHQVRAGALRGAILARQQDGLALLREQLRSGDYILFAAAVKTAQELPGSQVAGALTEALGSLPADNQVVVIQALGMRADASAVPVLLKAVRHEAKSVRLTAIRALGQLGHFSAASMLITLVGDADHDCAQAAQNSLAILSGPEVDTAVMGMLRGGDVDRRATALELIGQRRMKRALPLVVKAVGDQNEKIRSGAIRVLSEVGTAAELPTLLDLLLQAKTAEDTSAAEQAVSTLCARADQPETATEKVVARLGSAQPAQKVVLLRVLGSVGGGNALQAIRASVKDSNAEVHAAAIRTLAAWKTSEALPDLLALARNDQNPTDRMLGLRGYLGWATRRDQPPDQRLAICQQAAELVKKPEEKKLLLSALGNVASPASFNLILPCLDDPAVRNEASAAVVRVAETLLKGKETGKAAQQLIKPLEKAAEAATDPDLAQRAKTALRQARARAKK